VVAAAAVTASIATHLAQVWDQAFAFHVHGRQVHAPSTSANAGRLVHFLDPNTPFALLALAAIVIGVVAAARRTTVHWALWTWPVAAAATLVVQRPLLDHHLALFAAAWALPAGATIATAVGDARNIVRPLALAALAVLFAGGLVQQWRQLAPKAEDTDVAQAVARLRTLVPTGSVVASDLPIVPYRAGDRQPRQLVDLSEVRLGSGTLPDAEILRDSRSAAAFVVGRALANDDAVLAALRTRYRKRITVGSIAIYAGLRR
jgi:hypothetical protein